MTPHGPDSGPALVLDFAEIARQTRNIRGMLVSLGLRGVDLDDVLQDVLLGAWRSAQAGRFCPPCGTPLDAAIRIWLYGICFNRTTHYFSRAHRRHEVLVPEQWAAVQEPSGDAAAMLDAREALRAGFDLPEWARHVLAFAAVGFSTRETALALLIPVGTVRERLRRARKRLKALLAGRRR
jgi:RNA polymerase sigma-70 factor (ECF subfamily)